MPIGGLVAFGILRAFARRPRTMPRELLLDALPLPDAARPHLVWAQLHGSGVSLAVAEAAVRHGKTVCVIAPSAAAADRIEHELEFFGGAQVRRFPDYETLPYEPISAPQELLADRLLCLYQLARGERLTLVVEAGALLARLPPQDFVVSRSLELKVGDRLEHAAMIKTLTEHGYLRVEQVAEPGEFAVRGAVLDVYATGAAQPVRIDLFDDEIESLRMFDPQTQLSSRKTDALRILPAREFPFDEAAIKAFRERFRERFPVDPSRCPVYRTISEAQLPAGIEYYLPLFFASTVSLLDYLGRDALVAVADDALAGLDDAWRLVEERYEQLRGDIEQPILAPRDGFFAPEQIRAGLDARLTLALRARAAEDSGGDGEPSPYNAGVTHPLGVGVAATDDRITRWLGEEGDERTLLATSSPGHREMMLELLRNRGREQDPPDHRDRARHGTAEAAPAPPARARSRNRDPRAHGSLDRRARRARGPRRRPLPRAHDARRRRRADRVPVARIRGRRQALRAGAEPAPRHAL